MNSPIHILATGINHRTAPVEMRERFAIPARHIVEALHELRASDAVQEAVLLSTCNRVEIYVAGTNSNNMLAAVTQFLQKRSGSPPAFGQEFYLHEFPESARHLFEVAAALDSMVVGETEILGQVKAAYQTAHEAHQTGAILNRLFQSAFSAAKDVRTNTRIGTGRVSIGSVAVELAEQVFCDLNNSAVLLVGAGEMSETTAKALQSRGARSLIVSNRSHDRAIALAKRLGGEAVPWQELFEVCKRVNIVISSTAAPHLVITREKLEPVMRTRQGRPLFLIDIAVPRDIEHSVSQLEGVHLYDIDSLEVIADRNLATRQKEIQAGHRILQEHVEKFTEWTNARTTIPPPLLK
jgi:glutamyl-tRNA reductase